MINCGHYPIPIIPGVTIPHGADNIQPPEENAKAYAESQEQRRLERQIREAKRVVEMAGDTATKEDRLRVRDAQAQMREFIDRTGRSRRYDRERIDVSPQRNSLQNGQENGILEWNKPDRDTPVERNRAISINTVDDLTRVSSSPVSTMKSYPEIVTYFRDKYDINVEGFERKNLFSVQSTLAGFDDLISEFPDAGQFIRTIRYNSRLKDCGRMNSAGLSQIGPSGLQDYGTGVHEAAHALDFFRTQSGGVMYAESIMDVARKTLGLRKNSRQYRDLCYLLTLDPDSVDMPFEVFAYALESQKGNNGNALSEAVYSLVKEG